MIFITGSVGFIASARAKLRLAFLVGFIATLFPLAVGAQTAPRVLDPEVAGALTPMMIAQARAKAEALLAVGKPGVKVCRALLIGIAVRDWIRGEVIEVNGDRVGVRIDDPGQQPHVIDDRPLLKGMTIWSEAAEWTPCIYGGVSE